MKGKKTFVRGLRAAITAAVFFAITAAGITTLSPTGDTSAKKSQIIGTWTKRGFTYRFDADSTVTVTKIGGGPSGYLRSPYRWFNMGTHDCVSFRRDPSDSLSLEVLLVGNVTDSTAVLALGTPFVRSGEGHGIPGSWKHMDHFTKIEWIFSPETVSYRKSMFSIDTGYERTVEEYSGPWTRAEGNREPGTFILAFGGGSRTFVLPIVHRDMMYLFDVSPGKSVFMRARPVLQPDTLSTKISAVAQPRR